ncbi:MAG: V-type ATP synthase subunit E family protein [Thermoplasmata archaeon]
MGLEQVVEDILRKGEAKRREIISLGESERDAQVRQAERQAEEERARAEERLSRAIAQMEQQELSSAELESKKALLAAQRQVMEDLKQQVLHDLESYPEDKRRRLYSKLVEKAKRELGECRVYSREQDRPLLKLPLGMTYAGGIACRGGLVFESKDGSLRLDYRFESILEEVWNRNMQEIYTRLFR